MTIAYRDRENGTYPLTVEDVRKRFDGGLPANLTTSEYDLLKVDPVELTAAPSYDPTKQSIVEAAPVKKNGKWVQAWTLTALPAPTVEQLSDMVNAERDRRIALPIMFEDVMYQHDEESRNRIEKSRGSALAAIVFGGAQPDDLRWHGQPVDFFWIALDNKRTPMDAQTMVELGNASAAREGLLIAQASNLKSLIAGGRRFDDLTADALWP